MEGCPCFIMPRYDSARGIFLAGGAYYVGTLSPLRAASKISSFVRSLRSRIVKVVVVVVVVVVVTTAICDHLI